MVYDRRFTLGFLFAAVTPPSPDTPLRLIPLIGDLLPPVNDIGRGVANTVDRPDEAGGVMGGAVVTGRGEP